MNKNYMCIQDLKNEERNVIMNHFRCFNIRDPDFEVYVKNRNI